MDAVGGLLTLGLGDTVEEIVLAGLAPFEQPSVGAGEVDPRIWWDRYVRTQRRPTPAIQVEPEPIEAVVDIVGVAASPAVGPVTVLVGIAVEGTASRARTGWITTKPDPWQEIRKSDEDVMAVEP